MRSILCTTSQLVPWTLNDHTAMQQGHFLVQEIAACSQHHTELSLVTDWSPNLSFWSQMAAATHIAQPPPLPHEPYSPNHTYIALIASDGDSVQVCLCRYFSQPTLCRSDCTCLCLKVQLHDSLGQFKLNIQLHGVCMQGMLARYWCMVCVHNEHPMSLACDLESLHDP